MKVGQVGGYQVQEKAVEVPSMHFDRAVDGFEIRSFHKPSSLCLAGHVGFTLQLVLKKNETDEKKTIL